MLSLYRRLTLKSRRVRNFASHRLSFFSMPDIREEDVEETANKVTINCQL